MSAATDTIRVLHVDDDPALTELVATFLEREDDRIVVETATSVADGLERLPEVDCIVSDHDMPRQTGIEFLEAVREERPDLPFVLYTGKGSEAVAADAISAGVTDYLQKAGGTDQYAILANRVVNAVERHRIEREADRTRSQLQAIAENSSDVIIVVDADSRVRFANPAVEEQFGVAPAELRGERLTAIMPERYRAEHLAAVDRYLDTGERSVNWSHVEFAGQHRDGTEMPLSVSFSEFRQDGERRFLGILRDISERTRLEAELREREERLFIEQSLDVLQDVFCVFSRDGDLLRWNDQILELTGYSPDEIADMGPTDFFPAEHRGRIGDTVEEILETGASTVHADVQSRDGERTPHEFIGTRLTDEDGEILGFAGIGRDITERRERERELVRTRDLLERTERIADVGGWEIDTDTMDVFWTEHLFDILGVDYDEEPPLDEALDVYHEDDRPVVANAVERALDAGESFDVEVRFRRPDGEVRWLRVYGTPTVADGDVVALRGAIQDVTERKTHEQRLERQNDRLEQFASVVSHDLRNPLNVAEGHLALAREECDSEHLERVTRAQERMSALIDDLLALARDGEQVGDLDPADLATLAETCWENVATADATLVTDGTRTIRADHSRLQQLLENLVRNAVEHGSTSGQEASASGTAVTVTVGPLSDGFYVADDGAGIPADDRDRVFEAGHSTSEAGTGFGLSIVKQIAEAHGWTVAATESADGGARFEITGVEVGDD